MRCNATTKGEICKYQCNINIYLKCSFLTLGALNLSFSRYCVVNFQHLATTCGNKVFRGVVECVCSNI